MRNQLLGFGFVLLSLFATANVSALNIDFINKNIWLSKDVNLMEGDSVLIYSMILNNENKHVGGQMMFLDIENNQQVGGLVDFDLPGKGTNQVLSTKWMARAGNHQFRAKIINVYEFIGDQKKIAEVQSLSGVTDKVFVDGDNDKDGLLNSEEARLGSDPNKADTDGDSISDKQDPDPLKKDADGDGDPDNTDPAPNDPNIKTKPDTDKDGTPDDKDTDIDNDGVYNWDEEVQKTNPYKYDSDGDGVGDKQDAFPLDPKKTEPDPAPIPEVQPEKVVAKITVSEVQNKVSEEQQSEVKLNSINKLDSNIAVELESFLNEEEDSIKSPVSNGTNSLRDASTGLVTTNEAKVNPSNASGIKIGDEKSDATLYYMVGGMLTAGAGVYVYIRRLVK